MKDIDFDELDRAVNSLMSTVPSDKSAAAPIQPAPPVTTNAPSTATAVSEPSESIDAAPMPYESDDVANTTDQAESTDMEPMPSSVLDLNTTQNELQNDVPQEKTEVETFTEAMQLVEEAPSPTPAPTVRRGRFMDVVRPAVRDAGTSTPSRMVSRHGVSLQPSVLQPEEAPTPPHLMSAQPDDSDSVATEQSSESAITSDFTAFEDSGYAESIAPEYGDTEAPLSSPFLPGAKVEKRPLGRPVETAPAVDLAAELAGSAPEDIIASDYAAEDMISPNKDAQLPEQPLPAELGSELLSIETSADNLPPETPQPIAAPEVSSVDSAPFGSTPEPARAMTGASILQQYKVQPQQNTEEAPQGAIYDAQPLVHSAEKKSSWIWKLVAIIAIALLGAGGGAAIYYLGLI